MFIITAGLPKAGKSRAIDMLRGRNNTKWHVIRPSDWIPDNLANLDQDIQRSFTVECWSVAIEKCREAISEIPPREIIVLDGCNSKINTVLALIGDARAAMHHVVLFFVQAQINLCLQRDAKLTTSLLTDYAERYKVCLPKYKKLCDLFLVVRNNGTLEQLGTELHDTWKRLCQNI